MNLLRRSLFLLWLAAPLAAFAADEATPRAVTLEFRGSLRDGLRELAAKGGINLVVTGDLDQPAEIYLQSVSAEEALSTVAAAYQLKVQRQGSIWTLRPLIPAERATGPTESTVAPAQPPAPPAPSPTPAPAAEPEARKLLDKLDIRVRHDEGDVTATGSLVVEEGRTVENAVAYGGSITLKPGSVVEGNAVAFGGDVVLEEGSTVEGNAVAFGGQVRKAPGAEVEGEEVAMGGGLAAAVTREITQGAKPAVKDDPPPKMRRSSSVSGSIVWFLVLFGLGFLFSMFTPSRMKQLEGEIGRDLLKCALTGLVGAIALSVLTAVLAVTLVGIPLAIVLVLAMGLGVAMGVSAMATHLGRRLPLFRSRKTQALVLALGLVVMLIAFKLPVFGPLALTFVLLTALGATIRTRLGQRARGFPEPEPSPVGVGRG